MREASILLTAAVMSMAGAWYAMQDMTRSPFPVASPVASSPGAAAGQQASLTAWPQPPAD